MADRFEDNTGEGVTVGRALCDMCKHPVVDNVPCGVYVGSTYRRPCNCAHSGHCRSCGRLNFKCVCPKES